MRYIKTKDGIFEVIKENNKFVTVKFPFTGGVQIHKEMITSQADTVEELIDEFVEISNGKHHFHDTWYYTKMYCEDGQAYGAIWTTGDCGEPILKSVAKMNEKGELELL